MELSLAGFGAHAAPPGTISLRGYKSMGENSARRKAWRYDAPEDTPADEVLDGLVLRGLLPPHKTELLALNLPGAKRVRVLPWRTFKDYGVRPRSTLLVRATEQPRLLGGMEQDLPQYQTLAQWLEKKFPVPSAAAEISEVPTHLTGDITCLNPYAENCQVLDLTGCTKLTGNLDDVLPQFKALRVLRVRSRDDGDGVDEDKEVDP
eukprot:CAMPEP_0118972722 /NCGR_PEP_ID=MMETSP1173-20130426/8950_1 /TAXON_ID=1034831 /ORGANISM="Rhizochromulina marina cf, Strain CCMP1243" /LENGTH=205 /DNA_ID=CAMNT_0006922293 /DNA_START=110 /DNA_END=723 /DNA_ORIENTATION=+